MTELVVDGVARGFALGQRRVALHPCSFRAQGGEIIGVIGPNGAGKTTLLRLIAGEMVPGSGAVRIGGHLTETQSARRVIGYAFNPPTIPLELTGAEWLKYVASHRALHPVQRTGLVQWAIDLTDLNGFAARRVAEYSSGMVNRLALAGAAINGSAVLVLDEVLTGVDPLVAGRLRDRLTGLAQSNRIILVASHDLSTLERIATRVLVLWGGRLVADVSVARLVTERVAELSLNAAGLASSERLFDRYPQSLRTGEGIAIPLVRGLTIEKVLAACRSMRIAVAASRVRYRALDDIFAAAQRDGKRSP